MSRIISPLTNTQVDKAKSKDKEYSLSDGKGLYLSVTTKNSKIWRFNYNKPFTKKRTEISLGKYPEISLSQARKIREEYLELLAQDIDPKIYRQNIVDEEILKRENTFEAVANKWREKKSLEVQPKTMEKNWARLENHLFSKIGNVAVSEITPKMVIKAVEPLKARGVGDTLHRVIRLLNEVLNFAVNMGLIEFNKCVNVSANFSTHTAENNPTIRPELLSEFLSDLDDSNSSIQVKILIKWQLLTMVRPKEAVSAEWQEIDFDKKTWTIPAPKMKGGKRSHTVPLSRQAITLLEKIKSITGYKRFVFQSGTNPNKSMSSQTANRAIKLLVGGKYKDRLTAHGLRSIASTYLNEQLINYDVIEACLSHIIADQTRKAYNRSDYFDQRIEVMQQWGDYVERCSIKSTL
ncbi:tyrosine-type recombinase/integrase [Glaesserella parasuis]|uniref:tyrosine-type recombinase/integrase n=1 Tax=Glaesserella parasuis TaxID=738 RepID=UPI0003ABEB4C|nr:prophage CP4-57 integrase [Glaesserella parasuis SW140]MCT8567689.1 tyrosine-type recombinase/integrase [Glaesserella parasuis]MCT8672747.1 tyrosine-type recombinase/integrase [Glaesserella parasuis]MCT8687056.1 tyrosine-type recombinase/integrase [Glaesserella parasuis]MCT8697555.1 tyrosine-type recombinase/integrase [Glaesserella parasuis]